MSMTSSAVIGLRAAEVGRAGEEIVLAYLTRTYGPVTDLRADPTAREADIDADVPRLGTVEIKTDTYTTGNMVLEVWGAGRPGDVIRTTATWWLYYFTATGALYVARRDAVVAELVLGLAAGRYRLRHARTVTGFRAPKDNPNVVALVPVASLQARIPIHHVALDPRTIPGTLVHQGRTYG